MSRLYQLTGAYAELQARAEDGEDVSAELARLDDELELKAERVTYVLRNLKADQEACAAEEKRLAARRKSAEANEERLRDYLRTGMEAAGIKRIKCAQFTLSLSERSRVVIDDEGALPSEYTRTKVEPDKAKINAALKDDGEVVPGARVEIYSSLTIK